ncbi:MAG: right-handed parallel beta-helix repeat-containing protein [Treponema sp.]|nr:right-handed parallel beta-helix repeat-containing protein [Treponema sp.]
MKKILLTAFVCISLMFLGCRDFVSLQKAENSLIDPAGVENTSEDLTVLEYSKDAKFVELIFNAQVASQSRYAMPSTFEGVTDSPDYSVYASVSSDGGATYKRNKCECTGSEIHFTNYRISTNAAVTLKIKFEIIKGTEYDSTKVIMDSGSEISVTIPANTKIATCDKPVFMYIKDNTLVNGKVFLKLQGEKTGDTFVVDDDNFVIAGNELHHKNYNLEQDPGIRPGFYEITIGCRDSGKTKSKIQLTQFIIVYPGLTTDKWDDGTETLSFAKFAPTEFYVKGSMPAGSGFDPWPCSVGGAEGEGTMTAPYHTLDKALTRISNLPDKNSEYTIYCEGEFTGVTDGYVIPSGYKIKIVGLGSKKSVIDNTVHESSPVLKIEGTTSVTLENLELKNGSHGITVENSKLIIKNCDIHNNDATADASFKDGAGIFCKYRSTVYVMDNVTIHRNKAERGGGIAFEENKTATCVINGENTKIYANQATGTTASDGGGGVYVNPSTTSGYSYFTLKKGSIFANKAVNNGGGIYVNGGYMTGYNHPKVTIENGKIAGNVAKQGGGIYCTTYSTFTFTGGYIGGSMPAADLDLDTFTESEILAYENKGNYVIGDIPKGGGIFCTSIRGWDPIIISSTNSQVPAQVNNNGGAAGVLGADIYGTGRELDLSGFIFIGAIHIDSDSRITLTGDLNTRAGQYAVREIVYPNAGNGIQVLWNSEGGYWVEENCRKFGFVTGQSGVSYSINVMGLLEL